MTPPSTSYLASEWTLDELKALPDEQQLGNITEYNTEDGDIAMGILEDAGDRRVVVYGHDSGSDLLVEFFYNEGHEVGITASYLYDEANSYGSLSGYMMTNSPIGGVSGIDFFQIHVY